MMSKRNYSCGQSSLRHMRTRCGPKIGSPTARLPVKPATTSGLLSRPGHGIALLSSRAVRNPLFMLWRTPSQGFAWGPYTSSLGVPLRLKLGAASQGRLASRVQTRSWSTKWRIQPLLRLRWKSTRGRRSCSMAPPTNGKRYCLMSLRSRMARASCGKCWQAEVGPTSATRLPWCAPTSSSTPLWSTPCGTAPSSSLPCSFQPSNAASSSAKPRSMISNPAASCASVTHSGGLVITVLHWSTVNSPLSRKNLPNWAIAGCAPP